MPRHDRRERWEKINLVWNKNGTVSYEPTKKFIFSRELSSGDESDIFQTLNIPLMVRDFSNQPNVMEILKCDLMLSLFLCVYCIGCICQSAANQLKHGGRFSRLALSSMLNVLNQETFSVHTVKEMLWGYNDTLFKLAKDVMPPEQVLPHDMFGLFVGVSCSQLVLNLLRNHLISTQLFLLN